MPTIDPEMPNDPFGDSNYSSKLPGSDDPLANMMPGAGNHNPLAGMGMPDPMKMVQEVAQAGWDTGYVDAMEDVKAALITDDEKELWHILLLRIAGNALSELVEVGTITADEAAVMQSELVDHMEGKHRHNHDGDTPPDL